MATTPMRVEEQSVGRWLERIEEVDGEAGRTLRARSTGGDGAVRGSGRAY